MTANSWPPSIGEAVSFDAVDSRDEELRRGLVELKVGAPVILHKNIDDKLVNGS